VTIAPERPDQILFADVNDLVNQLADEHAEQLELAARIAATHGTVTFTVEGTDYPGGPNTVSCSHTIASDETYVVPGGLSFGPYSYQPLTADDLYAAVRQTESDGRMQAPCKVEHFAEWLAACTPTRGQLLGHYDGHEYYWDLPRNRYQKELDAAFPDTRPLEERCAAAAVDMARATAFLATQPPHRAYPW
jgi:hypothetical protein